MKFILPLILVFFFSGCVDMPVQQTQMVDDRPRLTFEASSLGRQVDNYELVIDSVSYGSLGQYLVNENALRIIDGSHQIEVRSGGKTVFSQSVFLGENVTRVVKVTVYD